MYRDKLINRQKELERNKSSLFSDVPVDGAWGNKDEAVTKPKKKGKGIKKYKQAPRHAYKIQNNKYGQIMVDTNKLFNNMKLEAYKGGSLVYEQMVYSLFS